MRYLGVFVATSHHSHFFDLRFHWFCFITFPWFKTFSFLLWLLYGCILKLLHQTYILELFVVLIVLHLPIGVEVFVTMIDLIPVAGN